MKSVEMFNLEKTKLMEDYDSCFQYWRDSYEEEGLQLSHRSSEGRTRTVGVVVLETCAGFTEGILMGLTIVIYSMIFGV